MSDPSARRKLGQYQAMIADFEKSFREGMAEIPQDVARSHHNIDRIKTAASNGGDLIEGFFENGKGRITKAQRELKSTRRKWSLLLLQYQWGRFKLIVQSLLLVLLLVWKKSKLLILIGIGLTFAAWISIQYLPLALEYLPHLMERWFG